MSTRLTTAIRESIVSDLLLHRFEKAVEEYRAESAELAVDVYHDIFSEADRTAMEALPDGWLPSSDFMGVHFGGSYTSVYFAGRLHGDLLKGGKPGSPVYKRIPANKKGGCAKAYETRHKFSIRHEKLSAKRKKLVEQIKEAKRAAESALNAVTTVKRLIETWPEIAPFASKFEGEKPQLPALPTDHLNSMLGLPVSEAA